MPARLKSKDSVIKEKARVEAFVNVGYDPRYDVLCAVDPGVSDLYNAVFFTKPDELVANFTETPRFSTPSDLLDVNMYLPDDVPDPPLPPDGIYYVDMVHLLFVNSTIH